MSNNVVIGEQNNVLKSDTPFQFHDGFENWLGVSYVEETFNGKRHYTIDGVKYPSITTVLAADPLKQEILRRWRKRVGEVQAEATRRSSTKRGTALHKLCEDYISNEGAVINSHQERENFFKVKKTLDSGVGKLYCLEKPLVSRELGIAGRVDLIGDFQKTPTVIDFKTSGKTKYHKNIHQYFIQGAAYATMFHEMTGIEIPQIAIIIVTEELLEPQIFLEKTSSWMQSLKHAIEVYRESVKNDQGNYSKKGEASLDI
jgi:hypothetical protein